MRASILIFGVSVAMIIEVTNAKLEVEKFEGKK